MGGERTAGIEVNHVFGIAMVGSDEGYATFGVDGGYDRPDALIDGFDGGDGGHRLPLWR